MSDWREEAACKGRPARIWFPGAIPDGLRVTAGDPYTYARSICAGCPVAAECLAYALETRESNGLWGGLDPGERRALERQAKPRRKDPAHGTARGYKQHRRLGEDACDECAEANRRAVARYNGAAQPVNGPAARHHAGRYVCNVVAGHYGDHEDVDQDFEIRWPRA